MLSYFDKFCTTFSFFSLQFFFLGGGGLRPAQLLLRCGTRKVGQLNRGKAQRAEVIAGGRYEFLQRNLAVLWVLRHFWQYKSTGSSFPAEQYISAENWQMQNGIPTFTA